ncbi:MAG: hypothetical protein GC156_09365 [Actinomycetales bacterium]|nr:hypothetical protein [Actinomycetales bacterium]
MTAMAAPLPAENLDAWRSWMLELKGPRSDEFQASNDRHGITRHSAWLQQNPDGSYVVIVLHDGPGGDTYMKNMAESQDPFDQWFARTVAEVHAMDMSVPPPHAESVL